MFFKIIKIDSYFFYFMPFSHYLFIRWNFCIFYIILLLGEMTLLFFNRWDDSPFFILALPLVAMFGLLVVAFETLIPWKNELNVSINLIKILLCCQNNHVRFIIDTFFSIFIW